jgi:serine/threonine-protein kinase
MLTGRLPHEVSSNLRQMLEGIVRTSPPRPRTLCPDLSDDVETIILKCLAKEPERRYQTVGELAGDIQRFLGHQPIDAKRDRPWYVFRKMVARHKAVFGLIFIMVTLIVGFAFFMAVLYQRASDSEAAARSSLEKAATVQMFIQDMINLSDPCRSPETSQMVGEMLDKAALSIGDRFRSNPGMEAEVRHMLGSVYCNLSRIDDAEVQEETALSLMESAYGESHPDMAKVLLCLGHIKISRRLLEDAEILLQRARLLLEDHYEGDPVLTARYWFNLAELRRAQFRIQDAETLFQRAHAIYKEHPGEDNMFMLKTLIKWSNMLLTEQERHGRVDVLDEAVEKLEEALGVMKSYPGENLWAECLIKLHLGRARLGYGQYESAAVLFEEAEQGAKKVYGSTHSLVGDITNLKGLVCFHQDRFDEAEECYHRAMVIHDESGEERIPCRAWTLWNLAHLRRAQEDLSGAATYLREAIGLIKKAPEPEQFRLPSYLTCLGQLLGEGGRWSEARPLFEETLTLRAKAGEGAFMLTQQAKTLLGECLAELGRYEEGEALLLEACEALAGNDEAPSDYVIHTLSSLHKLYKSWEKPERATEFAARLSLYESSH